MTRSAFRPAVPAAWMVTGLLLTCGTARAQDFWAPSDNDARHELHAYRRDSALLGAVTIGSVIVNSGSVVHGAPHWVGALGFLGGTAQIILGTRSMTNHPQTSAGNIFVGGAAILTSLSALARGADESRMVRTPEEGAHLRPWLGMDPDLEARAGATLSF